MADAMDRTVLEEQAILAKLAVGDVDGTARRIVVVEARVLLVVPADEPDVEVHVAVELCVDSLVGIVPDEVPPELRLAAELDRELGEARLRKILVCGNPFGDPGCDVVHGLIVIRRAAGSGVSRMTIRSTASPNPRTASSVGRGSITGTSLP